mgnify:CR=1 FL=1
MFNSVFNRVASPSSFVFPAFSGERIMMMPVQLGSLAGIPEQYHALMRKLYNAMEDRFKDRIGYLTIDEQSFKRDHSTIFLEKDLLFAQQMQSAQE